MMDDAPRAPTMIEQMRDEIMAAMRAETQEEFQKINRALINLDEQISSLDAERTARRADLDQCQRIRESITALSARIMTLEAAPRITRVSGHRGLRVLAPDPFSGKKGESGEHLINQCLLNFSAQPEEFATDFNKCIYALSYLRGSAATWAGPYIVSLSEGSPDELVKDFPAFKRSFLKRFGRPDRQREAIRLITRRRRAGLNDRIADKLA